MSHTPEPWITDTSHKYEWEGITIWSEDVVIAHVVEDQHDNALSNARLIVAAPELLKALKAAVQELYDLAGEPVGSGRYSDLDNAIAKAEGRL